jgi:hypothetical protein
MDESSTATLSRLVEIRNSTLKRLKRNEIFVMLNHIVQVNEELLRISSSSHDLHLITFLRDNAETDDEKAESELMMKMYLDAEKVALIKRLMAKTAIAQHQQEAYLLPLSNQFHQL